MTGVELDRAAAAIVPPVGAGGLCLVTDEQQRHRVAFVVNGRGKAAVGPSFTKPREAARFMDLLAGERPAPRPGQTTTRQDPNPGPDIASDDDASAGTPSSSSAGPTGASEPGGSTSRPDAAGLVLGSAAVPPVLCVGCGKPVPLGRRGQRRLTHGPACRQAASRNARGLSAKAASAARGANVRAERLGIAGRLTPADVLALWARQPTCVRCGDEIGIDHVQPMEDGGANDRSNLQNLGPACNSRKAGIELTARTQRAGLAGQIAERAASEAATGSVTPSRAVSPDEGSRRGHRQRPLRGGLGRAPHSSPLSASGERTLTLGFEG